MPCRVSKSCPGMPDDSKLPNTPQIRERGWLRTNDPLLKRQMLYP
jgi:hypothetical protein